MTNDTVQQFWKSYLDAYADIPTADRERLLRQSVADDIVFSNPTGEEGRGIGSLIEHVSQFQTKNPGGYSQATSFSSTTTSSYRNGRCTRRTAQNWQRVTPTHASTSKDV